MNRKILSMGFAVLILSSNSFASQAIEGVWESTTIVDMEYYDATMNIHDNRIDFTVVCGPQGITRMGVDGELHVTIPAKYDDHTLTYEKAIRDKNGPCHLFTKKKTFDYTLSGDTLILSSDEGSIRLTRKN